MREKVMRKTKIICTIGPASESEEMLKKLMKAGMNVCRFNFSHGDYEEHRIKFERSVKIAKELGLPVATMMDTKGPEIRLRDFENGKVLLEAGQLFTLTTEDVLGTKEKASITYKNLKDDVTVGGTILLDDGLIELVVEEIGDQDIVCKVINGGQISNHKGINVPGATLSMPYISAVDREDILFGIKMGYDYLAASFARSKEDILAIRELIKENHGRMKIIAKIENMQGINNLDEILEVSDGIMVARGDMGVEVPIEEVPILQKELIKKANKAGKIVITATQMLESMIKNPRPTRAESTDVANAIYDGTSAIMLSGETASGSYPLEAVTTMARIAERTEQDIDYNARLLKKNELSNGSITTAIAQACGTTAKALDAAAIITVTMSGFTAGLISSYQPSCQIIGCTMDETVYRQMGLMWGIKPLLIEKKHDAEELFMASLNAAVGAGYVKKGDKVVLTAGVPLGISGNTNMIRIEEI